MQPTQSDSKDRQFRCLDGQDRQNITYYVHFDAPEHPEHRDRRSPDSVRVRCMEASFPRAISRNQDPLVIPDLHAGF